MCEYYFTKPNSNEENNTFSICNYGYLVEL